MPHEAVLPCATSVDLYRSDDLEKLTLRAPKLQYLNLQVGWAGPHALIHARMQCMATRRTVLH